MPTIYKRKESSNRRSWTEAQLKEAIAAINNKCISVKGAAKQYLIPFTTLRRKLKMQGTELYRLGCPSVLGPEKELQLVNHIQKLQEHGFAPTRNEVREMAYGLVEKYGIKHKFCNVKKKAGKDWFMLFMKRHPELSIRKAEGVSVSRAQGMAKAEVDNYFKLLEWTLVKNDLLDKPGHIYNMDETGCQLNNRAELVVAVKGSKNVPAITSAEKGETVTVIACCNAEGTFLPPACVFKGKYKKPEFEDGMPPGSVVYMGEKSAYVTSDLFFKWLKEHFVPRKPSGKTLLLLDGHSSHCSNVDMLEYAIENDIILLCLPPHTTQFLQPLDRTFFKPLKTYYYAACNSFVKNNPARKISRLLFGQLLCEAWTKAASVSNGTSGFSSTGIYPFSPNKIPDHAFLQDCIEKNQEQNMAAELQSTTEPQNFSQDMLEKPEQFLNEIAPVPTPSKSFKRSTRKQTARILTSPENVVQQKTRSLKRKPQPKKKTQKRKLETNYASSDEADENVVFQDESDGPEDLGENECVGCGEEYGQTTKKEDWIQCVMCCMWLHETCTSFVHTCNNCGNKNLKAT